MRSYFDHFAFQSITTSDFLAYLKENLFDRGRQFEGLVPIQEWIYEPGMPAGAPQPRSEAFVKVEEQANRWLEEKISAAQLQANNWTTHEWLHFLRHLPKMFEAKRMAELDQFLHLTESGNSEITHQWLLMAIRNDYTPAFDRLKEFLITTGREKLIKPLYEELAKSIDGKRIALAIYREARHGYHPLVVKKIDRELGWKTDKQ